MYGQDFMFQGWHWDYPMTISSQRYIAYLDGLGEELKNAGFTYIWLPPLSNGSSGYYSMGYDVRDYYDLGQYVSARWGYRYQLDTLVAHFQSLGLYPVADLVYNHRDGGKWEDNGAVEGWIENMNLTKITNGDQPYPSDRFRCYLPIGGTTGNNAGNYYFKIHSASGYSGFYTKPYEVMMWTNKVAANYSLAATAESEPNGGADCGEGDDIITLGKKFDATIDNGGCGTDEVALTLSDANFYSTGDTLWIKMYNTGGGLGNMTDHFIYGLWNGAAAMDIQPQIKYQTATDFTSLASGMGAMNYMNFKPNGNPTQLAGDQDAMLFYYDVDQYVPSSESVLQEFTKWMWEDAGMRGYRLDAVKHFPAWFTGDMMDYLHDNGIDPGMVVGEDYDYSPSVLKGWIDDVQNAMDADTKSAISIRVFDFALRNELDQACDVFGYDVRNIFNSGIVDGAGGSGFNVVTFVNNHDFRDGDQPITNEPELAYAYIITNNKLGIPCVYYSDYYDPKNLRYKINGLMEVHQKYIYGATYAHYLSRFSTPYAADYSGGFPNTSLIYQLSNSVSGREVVVAINFAAETLKVNQAINMDNISAGDTLTDIFTVTPTAYQLVSSDGKMYMEVPPRSFAVWVQGDLTGQTIDISTPLGIEPVFNKQKITVYPDPAHDYLTIEGIIEKNPSVMIFDMAGKIIRTIILSEDNKIPVSYLPSGMYLLKINSGNYFYTAPFIKD